MNTTIGNALDSLDLSYKKLKSRSGIPYFFVPFESDETSFDYNLIISYKDTKITIFIPLPEELTKTSSFKDSLDLINNSLVLGSIISYDKDEYWYTYNFDIGLDFSNDSLCEIIHSVLREARNILIIKSVHEFNEQSQC